MASPNSNQISDADLTKTLKLAMERDSNNPIKVEQFQETPLERSKRISNYLQSGAVAICTKCDLQLLFCQCTNLGHGEHVNFGWPPSYTTQQKKENLLRWCDQFAKELPKNKNNECIFNLQLIGKDYLNKNIINILSKRKNDLQLMMNCLIDANKNDLSIKNFGNDAVMFLTDLNILCGSQRHWVLLNNAFQVSDPNKFSVDDSELKLIYYLVAILMEINQTVKVLKEKNVSTNNNGMDVDKTVDPIKKCGNCSKSSNGLLRCSRCKNAYYCNADCQRSDWKQHKKNCHKAQSKK